MDLIIMNEKPGISVLILFYFGEITPSELVARLRQTLIQISHQFENTLVNDASLYVTKSTPEREV